MAIIFGVILHFSQLAAVTNNVIDYDFVAPPSNRWASRATTDQLSLRKRNITLDVVKAVDFGDLECTNEFSIRNRGFQGKMVAEDARLVSTSKQLDWIYRARDSDDIFGEENMAG